ncbi:hypothetical protein L1987_48659 [Smallanthus sonchifolius]|uniref:Uncharacterized protein n=1 Tax=Smallanthus sonchifolius TaxID=185202 RepID=A0ACB9FTG2_9ASTR|nr:hypothetical protein L1987_48659 [Smallanthus sonchifolius]
MNKITPSGSVSCFLSKASVDESSLWHKILSHVNVKTIYKLVRGNLVRGLPDKEFQFEDHYIACLKGKQHKSSHKPNTINSNDTPLPFLHMDLFGPTNVMSMGKKSYCLVITDHYTRYLWVYVLITKDETTEILKSFIIKVENQSNQKVKIIRCDQGTELKNQTLNCFCEGKGIQRQYSTPRTRQQNGVAERRNRTLIESARSMLADSKLPLTFWAEAFSKPFGCSCTILITNRVLPKFGAKSDEGYFVGHSSQSKAYRVYNTRTRITEESANVECSEHVPCKQGKGPDWLFDIESFSQVFKPFIFSSMESSQEQATSSNDDYIMSFNDPSVRLKRPSIDPPFVANAIEASEARTCSSNVTSSSISEPDNTNDTIIHSTTGIEAPAVDEGIQIDVVPAQRINKEHPLENVIGPVQQGVQTIRKTQEANICLYSCFLSQVEPKKVDEALQHSSWIEAMHEELLQFQRHEVWKLVNLPPGQTAIGTRRVFGNKEDERGIVIKNKDRLVDQGYT